MAAGAAVLGLASMAFADVASAPKVYITGSTAFRKATMTALTHIFASGYTYAYDGSKGLSGASRAMFYGTVDGNEVVVKCYWSGSAAGVDTVSNSKTLSEWMADDTALATDSGNNPSSFNKESAVPNVCMSDTAQSLTPFTATSLTPTKVGVVPFVFVKGRLASGHSMKTAFDAISNISALQAQKLLSSGIKLAQLTGSSADSGRVYVLGRNPESGTRLTTFAETGFGTNNTALQAGPLAGGDLVAGVVAAIDEVDVYPAGTVNGIFADDGNNGFSSGGTLGDVLSSPVSASAVNDIDTGAFALIGYLGVNDAAQSIKDANTNVSNDVSRILSYNGASLNPSYDTDTQAVTWDYTALQEGKYTFWSYEYLMYRTTLTGVPKSTADAIATQIISTDAAQSGLRLSDMHATRQVEGGAVTHQ